MVQLSLHNCLIVAQVVADPTDLGAILESDLRLHPPPAPRPPEFEDDFSSDDEEEIE